MRNESSPCTSISSAVSLKTLAMDLLSVCTKEFYLSAEICRKDNPKNQTLKCGGSGGSRGFLRRSVWRQVALSQACENAGHRTTPNPLLPLHFKVWFLGLVFRAVAARHKKTPTAEAVGV